MNSLSAFIKLSQLPKNLQEEVMDFIDDPTYELENKIDNCNCSNKSPKNNT